MLSLQKVKETLRRLRWHQQHSSESSHHRKGRPLGQQILSDLCNFLKGEDSEGRKNNSADANVSHVKMYEAMKLQHKRAEVCFLI